MHTDVHERNDFEVYPGPVRLIAAIGALLILVLFCLACATWSARGLI